MMEVLNSRLSNSQRPGGSLTGDSQRGASSSATLALSTYNHHNSPVGIYLAEPDDVRCRPKGFKAQCKKCLADERALSGMVQVVLSTFGLLSRASEGWLCKQGFDNGSRIGGCEGHELCARLSQFLTPSQQWQLAVSEN